MQSVFVLLMGETWFVGCKEMIGSYSCVLGDSHTFVIASITAGRCSGSEGKVPQVHF